MLSINSPIAESNVFFHAAQNNSVQSIPGQLQELQTATVNAEYHLLMQERDILKMHLYHKRRMTETYKTQIRDKRKRYAAKERRLGLLPTEYPGNITSDD